MWLSSTSSFSDIIFIFIIFRHSCRMLPHQERPWECGGNVITEGSSRDLPIFSDMYQRTWAFRPSQMQLAPLTIIPYWRSDPNLQEHHKRQCSTVAYCSSGILPATAKNTTTMIIVSNMERPQSFTRWDAWISRSAWHHWLGSVRKCTCCGAGIVVSEVFASGIFLLAMASFTVSS